MASAAAQMLDVVEACYRVDVDQAEWLADIVRTSTPLLDRGLGVLAYTYVVREAKFQMLDVCAPPTIDVRTLGAYLSEAPPGYVERSWLSKPYGLASQVEGFDEIAPALATFGGARDVLALNGCDPTGRGVWLGALTRERGRQTQRTLDRLGRISAHLATAYRLRRALDRSADPRKQSEAILRPDGRIDHAEGQARGAAERAALRRAAIRLDRAKSKKGRADAERTLAEWKSMVEARWTLLDHFDHDGRHYVLARRNDASIDAVDDLTPRERQVVAYAALGHDNKVIAYELGLAAATVRVLLHRSAKKFGVATRADLVNRWKATKKTR
jgi:DNA-binding CsgD family transcriptional regulator